MKYVRQIRGKWTVRVTVPEKLRGLIGKRELVATDLSSKPREREAQAHRIINEFLGQIEQAHAKLALMEVSAELPSRLSRTA